MYSSFHISCMWNFENLNVGRPAVYEVRYGLNLLHPLTLWVNLSLACRTYADINECAEGAIGSEMCLGLCVNDPGSFHCDCYTGYTLNPDMVSCSGTFIMKKLIMFSFNTNWCLIDLNECTTGVAKCDQGCTNTLGSYSCHCEHGYVLNTDGYHCDGII